MSAFWDGARVPDDVWRAGLIDRLRIRWDAMGEMANDERADAAMELVRLRIERDSARSHVLRLLEQSGGAEHARRCVEQWGWA